MKTDSPVALKDRVRKSRSKARADGAERLDVWLTPEAAQALRDEQVRGGDRSKTGTIIRLIMQNDADAK